MVASQARLMRVRAAARLRRSLSGNYSLIQIKQRERPSPLLIVRSNIAVLSFGTDDLTNNVASTEITRVWKFLGLWNSADVCASHHERNVQSHFTRGLRYDERIEPNRQFE